MSTHRRTTTSPPQTTSRDDLVKQRQELLDLNYKRAKFVTCPACRHGSTTIMANERLAGWRYAACTAVAIVFAPLTLGVMLFMLPLFFKPQFAVHSCRRCGLRLAITTGGLGDYAFTLAADVTDSNFAPAEDDWRPDLARLPGGMRVARSPLGPRPEISEPEMKTCSRRFAGLKARTKIKLVSEDWLRGTVRCMVVTGPDNPATAREREQGEGEVFCQIHTNDVADLGLVFCRDASPNIQVTMRAAAVPSPQTASDKDLPPPPHAPAYEDSSALSEFTETCLIRLFPGDNYSVHFYLPSSSPPAYAAPSSSAAEASRSRQTLHASVVPKRFRTQFWGGMPVWRWKSSEGNLLWVSRRFRDADMSALSTTLCLVDDYERLVAAVDGWEGRRVPGVASAPDGSGGMVRECRMKLYADLDAGVLGEILGSYCALLAQVRRVTRELKREDDAKRSSY
ncbi:hypothetical protein ISF_09062 [Cordyceps fumosorosea ARSEF 2679]|uniref:LITAF domain-containing protein n=1 Tax=Cordyceps fumosorosea (strain ARSEF 2679) TaxID=1081104 RepID=A0A162K459_CORFA|nr:hypothetical protein ISF_09062 [Cordyceps fumosorosea ARSEF 2679]OAA53108.1 hypothetical protein ISF_09062 [Cordyceps fumosorosea ARSEF 2679]